MAKRRLPVIPPAYDKLIDDCAEEITSRAECEYLTARQIVIRIFKLVKEYGDANGWGFRGDC